MRAFLFAVACGFVTAKKPTTGTCHADQAEIQAIRAELATTKAQLNELLARTTDSCSAHAEFSVVNVATKTKDIAAEVVQHILDRTDVDDQIFTGVTDKYVQVTENIAGAIGVVEQAAAVDYAIHVRRLTSHDAYVTHVVPALTAVTAAAEPYMKEYVRPGLAAATVHGTPHFETAKETLLAVSARGADEFGVFFFKGRKFVETEVPRAISTMEGKLSELFHYLERATPLHGQVLPKNVADRVLLVIVVLVLSFMGFRFGMVAFRFAMRVSRFCIRIVRVAFLAVSILLRIAFTFVKYIIWFGTLFYCCGVCKKHVPKTTKPAGGTKTGSNSKNGVAGNTGNSNAAMVSASSADITSMLETNKKKGKLVEAVTLLAKFVGKTIEGKQFPEEVRGKVLDKTVLKAAVAKFKEVDPKKFAL